MFHDVIKLGRHNASKRNKVSDVRRSHGVTMFHNIIRSVTPEGHRRCNLSRRHKASDVAMSRDITGSHLHRPLKFAGLKSTEITDGSVIVCSSVQRLGHRRGPFCSTWQGTAKFSLVCQHCTSFVVIGRVRFKPTHSQR